MTYTIYLITNLVNGKVYVGQTCQPLRRRWGLHKSRAARNEGYTAHLYNSLRKYGLENFSIKEIATCETEEWSDYLERLYILIYDSMNPEVGYNMTSGGDKPHPTPDKIEKQRQKLLGRKRTEEAKRKTSESLKIAYQEGRHPGTKGRKATQEEREKQSKRISGSGHPNFNHRVCSEELVFLWNNGVFAKDIASRFGISRETVTRRIRSTGLPYYDYSLPGNRSGSRSGRYKKIDENLLQHLYSSGLSMRKIAQQLETSHHVVSARIESLGLKR